MSTPDVRPALSELARVVSREVRETDLLSHDAAGQLSVVLLDADLTNSMRVIDRLLARLEHHEFSNCGDDRSGRGLLPHSRCGSGIPASRGGDARGLAVERVPRQQLERSMRMPR